MGRPFKFKPEQLKFIVECFSKDKSAISAKRAFTKRFGDSHWLRKIKPYTFQRAYENFMEKGQQHSDQLSKKKKKEPSKKTENTVQRIKDFFEENPSLSLRKAEKKMEPRIPRSTV